MRRKYSNAARLIAAIKDTNRKHQQRPQPEQESHVAGNSRYHRSESAPTKCEPTYQIDYNYFIVALISSTKLFDQLYLQRTNHCHYPQLTWTRKILLRVNMEKDLTTSLVLLLVDVITGILTPHIPQETTTTCLKSPLFWYLQSLQCVV